MQYYTKNEKKKDSLIKLVSNCSLYYLMLFECRIHYICQILHSTKGLKPLHLKNRAFLIKHFKISSRNNHVYFKFSFKIIEASVLRTQEGWGEHHSKTQSLSLESKGSLYLRSCLLLGWELPRESNVIFQWWMSTLSYSISYKNLKTCNICEIIWIYIFKIYHILLKGTREYWISWCLSMLFSCALVPQHVCPVFGDRLSIW